MYRGDAMARLAPAAAVLLLCLATAGPSVKGVEPAPSASPSPSVPGSASRSVPSASVAPSVPSASASRSASVAPSAAAAPSPTLPEPTRRIRPGPTLPPLEPLPILDPSVPRPDLDREVVAYLPYWMAARGFQGAPAIDPATDPWIRDGRITDLVLFSVGIRRDGALKLDEPNARFVLGSAATRIIRAAHARGIRVLVSFVSGGYANNAVLFKDRAARHRFAREAAALVRLRGLDGADLDVELIRRPRFRGYARTAGLLKAHLVRDNPAARVTVATNGAKSGAMMAAMALSAGADRAFLMGYAYRSGGSSPVGSISPLHHPTDLDLRDSIALYRSHGVDLRRVVLGLPTYGMTWPTDSPEPNASRSRVPGVGGGEVVGFHRAIAGTQPFGAVWDEVPGDPSARVRWFDPDRRVWWQTYVDTPATWRPKLLFALEAGLAGIGLWALGYEGGLAGYPDMVHEVLGLPVIASAAVTPALGATLAVTVSATTLSGGAPTRWTQLSNDGASWSPPIPADAVADIPWRLADGPDGERRVLVRSRDVAGRWSMPFAARTRLDRSGPTVVGPVLTWTGIGWRISFAQADASGFRPVKVRHRVADGPWSAWRGLRTPGDALVPAGNGTAVSVELRVSDPLGNTTIARGSAS